jgi:hypothetical protein
MRQSMSDKNVKKLARKLNLPIVHIQVRGGTDHRKDLFLEDHSIVSLYTDGSMEP